MNTINSPEYKILSYLNTYDTDSNITDEILRFSTKINESEFKETIKAISAKKYIGKESPNNQWIILEEGKLRLAKMETDVKVETLQYAISKNTDATNYSTRINVWTNIILAAVGVVGVVFTIVQLYLFSQQNDLLREELKLERQQYKLEKRKLKKEKSYYKNTYPYPNVNLNIDLKVDSIYTSHP